MNDLDQETGQRCATENELIEFADGLLDGHAYTWVEQHVDTCMHCSGLLAEVLQGMSSGMGCESTYKEDQPGHASTLISALADGTAYGQRVGRFVLLEHVGTGGMGFVYTAYDPELARTIALKLIRPQLGRTSGHARVRLLREAQAAARLKHPHVVTVYEAGEAQGVSFIALEYVQGVSLRTWLRQGTHTWREVLAVFLDAGEGLAAAHRAGVLHRDFKPDNVLLDRDGRAKVADFGLAAGVQDEALQRTYENLTGSHESLDLRMTKTGTLLGTPAYMAPEQHHCADVDVRADQYSFAVSLYEALYGEYPFSGSTVEALLEAKQAAALPTGRSKGVPGWLRAVVIRGLQPSPEQRWRDMDAMLAALRANPVLRRGLWAATAVLVGGALTAAGVHAYQRAEVAAACKAEGQAIYDLWSPQQAEQIGQAFARTKIEYAQESWARARPRIDAYVENYARSREELCRAGELDGSIEPKILVRARECLDRGYTVVDNTLSAWRTPEAFAITRAPGVAATLPRVEDCTNVERLTRKLALDNPNVFQETYAKLREKYHRARQIAHEGDSKASYRLASDVEDEALSVGAVSLASAASLTVCNSFQQQARYEEAKDACTRSFLQAVEASDNEGAVHAATFLVSLNGQAFHDRNAAELWLDIAEAYARTVETGGTGPLRARLLSARGYLGQDFDEPEMAIASFRQAIEQYNQIYGEMSDISAPLWTSIAYISLHKKNWTAAREAIEEARGIYNLVFGPRHPATFQVEWYRAQIRHASDPAGANAMFEEVMGTMSPERAARYAVTWRAYTWDTCQRSQTKALAAIEAAFAEGTLDAESLPELLVHVGRCHQTSGNLPGAREAGTRALSVLGTGADRSSETFQQATALAAVGQVDPSP